MVYSVFLFSFIERESVLALGAFGEQAALSPSVVNRQYDVIERLKSEGIFLLLFFHLLVLQERCCVTKERGKMSLSRIFFLCGVLDHGVPLLADMSKKNSFRP